MKAEGRALVRPMPTATPALQQRPVNSSRSFGESSQPRASHVQALGEALSIRCHHLRDMDSTCQEQARSSIGLTFGKLKETVWVLSLTLSIWTENKCTYNPVPERLIHMKREFCHLLWFEVCFCLFMQENVALYTPKERKKKKGKEKQTKQKNSTA